MIRRAFTLIELLVVIAVIALLIGIILPALGQARKASRLSGCTANLRSIGQGLSYYAADTRGRFPYWSNWQIYGGDGMLPDYPGLGWAEQLEGDLSGVGAFHDPSRDRDLAPFSYFMQTRWVFVRTGQAYTSQRDSDVQLSAQFVLAGDCNQPMLFPQPYGSSLFPPDCDQDDASIPCVFFEGELKPHDGKTNILFLDTHAAAFKGFEKDKMTWHGAQMKDWSLQ